MADLVTHMATNIIDVNLAHTTQTLEPVDLQERAYEYGRQLNSVSAKLAQKYAYLKQNKTEGLTEMAPNVADKLAQSEILNSLDKTLINEVAARAAEANAEFKVDPVPNLIGVFGQIQHNGDESSENDENEEDEDEEIIDQDDENVRKYGQNESNEEDEESS